MMHKNNLQQTPISYPGHGDSRGSEKLDYCFELTRLVARKDFIALSRRANLKSHMKYLFRYLHMFVHPLKFNYRRSWYAYICLSDKEPWAETGFTHIGIHSIESFACSGCGKAESLLLRNTHISSTSQDYVLSLECLENSTTSLQLSFLLVTQFK
jgi:hypothetical protein